MSENFAERALVPRWARQRLHLMMLGVAVAIAAIVVLSLLLQGGSGSPTPVRNGKATIVSRAQLEQFAAALDYPVYWAGAKAGFSYELTATNDRTWVRYLPAGVAAGDQRADLLVVGTYRQPHSYANLRRAAARPGGVSLRIGTHGLLVFNSNKPTSLYFSYPTAKYQVEVYDPLPDTARALVLGGKIEPVR